MTRSEELIAKAIYAAAEDKDITWIEASEDIRSWCLLRAKSVINVLSDDFTTFTKRNLKADAAHGALAIVARLQD